MMEFIHLQNGLKLSFEKLPHTIRLIVSKDETEWVCRKEKAPNLLSFLESDEDHLFKGRLQLFKMAERIHVQVKNEQVGIISTEIFRQALNTLK